MPHDTVRFRSDDLRALDVDNSGAVTARDARDACARTGGAPVIGMRGEEPVHVTLSSTPRDIGRAARLFAFAKAALRSRLERSVHAPLPVDVAVDVAVAMEAAVEVEHIDVPAALLGESAPERALLA